MVGSPGAIRSANRTLLVSLVFHPLETLQNWSKVKREMDLFIAGTVLWLLDQSRVAEYVHGSRTVAQVCMRRRTERARLQVWEGDHSHD